MKKKWQTIQKMSQTTEKCHKKWQNNEKISQTFEKSDKLLKNCHRLV